MKIGIITFHHVDNYGALLQAYALWSFLRNKGYEVELVDYRPYKAIRYYLRGLNPISIKSGFNPTAFSNIRRASRMRRFLRSKTVLSKSTCYSRERLRKLNSKYDVVITGSDQVWCINSIRGFDPSYFLDFSSNKRTKKISYAASCGDIETFGQHKEEISKLVNEFHEILVRDTNSSRIVADECNRSSIRVLDPTFLIDYSDLVKPSKSQENYLLVYTQGQLEPDELKAISAIAKSKNLAIFSVGGSNLIAQKSFIDAGPQQWLSLFRQATHVVTNTYHGTIFSILFERQFTFLFKAKKVNKVYDLLQIFGLESRILEDAKDATQIKQQSHDIDYGSISSLIDTEIKKSQSYLIKAINS